MVLTVTLIPNMVLSTVYDKYLLFSTTKKYIILRIVQKRGPNGSTGIISYAESYVINANIT